MAEVLAFLRENKYYFEDVYYAGFLMVLANTILKLGLFKKIKVEDLFYLLILGSYFVLNLFFKTDYNSIPYALVAVFLVVVQYGKTIRFFRAEERIKVGALNHIKNADYDYFVTVDPKDRIMDFSNTIAQKFGMGESELLKSKFWEIFSTHFDIVGINEQTADKERLAAFQKEYFKKVNFNVSYQLRIQVRNIEGQLEYYQFLVKPVYYKDHYLGKNIFINRNRWHIISELNSSLANLMDQFEEAKQQSHLWLSMATTILLYYDYQSKTYVLSETLKKVLNTQKGELTEKEFLELVHPDDLEKYLMDRGSINSQEVTSIIFRLKINSKYRKISEEAILAGPQNELVSIIKTLPVREENSDNVDYIKSLTTPAPTSEKNQAIRTESTTISAPSENLKELESSDDLQKLAEKMQKKDVDHLESLLHSAIKKRDI